MAVEQRPGQGKWMPAEGAEGLAQVFAPKHSYEQYAQSDASLHINNYALQKLTGQRSRIVDVASGTGASIQASLDAGKLTHDFRGIGIDIDEKGLFATREKFRNYNGADLSGKIELAQGSGEVLPVVNEWADLVTCLNAVHLLGNPQNFFSEAYRVLDQGDLVVNSAYGTEPIYADNKSKRALQLMLLEARQYAAERGFKAGPPFDPARFNENQYKEMAEQAGFKHVKTEAITVSYTPEDLEAIFSSEEFAEGALPQVPLAIAIEGLVSSVRNTLERVGVATMDRKVLILTAQKTK